MIDQGASRGKRAGKQDRMRHERVLAWTTDTRARTGRDRLRYRSDLTDAEWQLVAPLVPPAKHGGRRRSIDTRELVNGLMYVLSTGCQWRDVPKDLPARSTLFDYLDLWSDHGVIDRIHHAMYDTAAAPAAARSNHV